MPTRIVYREQEYELPDPTDFVPAEASKVREFTGLFPRQLLDAAQNLDPGAVAAWIFVAKKRAGEKPQWADLQKNFKLGDCEFPDVNDDDEGELDLEGQPDPTT